MKKPLILLLCALLMAQTMTACSDAPAETDADNSSETEAVTETLTEAEQKAMEKEAYYDSLAASVSEPGTEINFISGTWEDISADELTGERYNDAMYNLNLEVEERLDVKIVNDYREDRNTVTTTINGNVLAGDGTYDVISSFAPQIAAMFAASSLLNMSDIPYLQLEEDWWNQSANENLSIAGYNYTLISSLCHNAQGVAMIILFNKDMCIDYNIDLPYDYVREGTWTYDKMYEMTQVLPLDSNGDGAMNDMDIMGYTGQLMDVQGSMIASGVDYFEKDENDVPQFILQSENNINKFEKLFNFFTDKNRVVLIDAYNFAGSVTGWDYWNTKFQENGTLFMRQYPCNMSVYTEMEQDYGILPMPKYDEAQEEYRCMGSKNHTSGLCVPKVFDADPADIGLVLDAMSYLSYVDVEPDYVQSYLEQRYVRDEDSAEMMLIAIRNIHYDPGFILGANWGDPLAIPNNVVKSGTNTLVSSIAGKSEAVAGAIAEVVAEING